MKDILVGMLLVISPLLAQAQNNVIFEDIGTTGDGFGASATYNTKLFKHFGVGAGVQGYKTVTSTYNLVNTYQFVPAIYADLRGYLQVRKSLFFGMVDLGVDIYKVKNGANPADDHSNGFYTGLGVGYCCGITRRGSGPYMTIKLISDTYSTTYHTVTKGDGHSTNANGTSAISIGYKF